MARCIVVAFVLLCVVVSARAQTTPAPGTAAAQSGTVAVKPAAKKPPPKVKSAAKPTAAAESGPCRIGVITAIGDVFAVQKVGLTVFGNAYTEVPVSWGLEDLVFARTRAAAGGIPLRRITYAKGTFDSYYHPQSSFFRKMSVMN